MATSKKFSELPAASSVGNGDLFAIAHEDALAETGYVSQKLTAAQAGQKVNGDTEYPTSLPSFPANGQNPFAALEKLNSDIIGLYPVNTASGSIATFSTSLALPLVAMSAEIVAQQAGTGTPTPSNPRSISGVSSVGLTHTGKNLFNGTFYANAAYSDADFNVGTSNAKQKSIKLWLGAGTYTISFGGSNSMRIIRELFDGGYSTQAYQDLFSYTFTTAESGYVGLSFRREDNENWVDIDIQIEKGSTATAYEPYNGETKTIALPETIYGGVLDVTRGKLTADYVKFLVDKDTILYSATNSSYANIFYDYPFISNNYGVGISDQYEFDTWGNVNGNVANTFTIFNHPSWVGETRLAFNRNGLTHAEFVANLENNPITVAFKLETPFDIDLTPEVISALVGTNNIFADCGDISVSFKQGIQEYIDAKIAETQALIL